jgi:Phage major capsid protein E
MPQPSVNQVHIDAILTNISVAYLQNQDNFIADKVFPLVPVDKRSNKYFKYTKNDWFRDEAQRRAGGTESAGSGYNLSTDTYSTDVFAFHKDVDDQTISNADAPLNPLREAAEFVTRRLLLRRELQFVSDYLTTSVWGTDITGVSGTPSTNQVKQWSDFANSDPLEDIEAGKETILSTTGFMPNTLVLGYQVFRKLKNHPDIVDRIKYTTANVVDEQLLASLLNVDKVLVAKGVKATNNEGATDAYGFTFGKAAWLGYSNPNPSLLAPSAGYIFSWNGVSGGLGTSLGISQFRMEQLRATRVEGEMAFDNKVVATDLGYFFTSIVA